MIAEKATVYNNSQQASCNINPILHKCKQPTIHPKFVFHFQEKGLFKENIVTPIENVIRNTWLKTALNSYTNVNVSIVKMNYFLKIR